jgi:hypothetical protein
MQAGVDALERLIDARAMPQVLRPVDERRDPWDRRTLRTVDEDGVRREFYVLSPADLTRPCLWFATGANPREIAPLFVELDAVDAGMSLRT